MSSNEKMVMIPRELVEQAMLACFEAGFGIPHDALRKVLQSADQPPGEPVAYLCKSEGAKWLQYGSKVGDPWKPGEVEVTPLFAHADPAEIERLRERCTELEADFAGMAKANDALINQRGEAWMERDTLRAQLAEAHSLLREIEGCPWVVDEATIPKAGIEAAPQQVVGTMHVGLIRLRKIRAALSVSAEPRAPKCKTCHDQGEVFVRKGDVHYGMQTEPEPVMAACPECAESSAPIKMEPLGQPFAQILAENAEGLMLKASAPKHETCKSCHGEGVTHTGTEESPSTLCNRCDGSGNEPKPETCCGSCPAGCVISASAQVERDERAPCLNDWFLSLEPGRQAVLREDKWMLANAAFEAGLARAALERKP